MNKVIHPIALAERQENSGHQNEQQRNARSITLKGSCQST